MRIAIHDRSDSFSERWINYCKQRGLDYKIVNAYSSDIVRQLSDCDVFMWHHSHGDYRDVLFAKQLLYSLETSGIVVFPNFRTGWFFDDKVGEKYLLESIAAPMVPSYVFYTKEEAYQWINSTHFPKVFKLRCGAGASNVKLVHNAKEARRIVRKAFSSGFPQFDRFGYLKDRFVKWRQGTDTFSGVLKGIGRLLIPTSFSMMHAPEKGYVYFQDFIDNNNHDIRVIVIGNRAFSIKRLVRKGDFRASGSGVIIYDKAQLDEEAVRVSFAVTKKMGSQCMGFDFVYLSKQPLIVEMGYGFAVHGYDKCEGYWTDDMMWHAGCFNPQEWMLDLTISSV